MKKKIIGGIAIGCCGLCIAGMAVISAKDIYTEERPLAKTIEEETETEDETWSDYELEDALGPVSGMEH